MTSTVRRDLSEPDTQLRFPQRLASRLWPARPGLHVGVLTWQRFQHLGREAEWPTAWWERDGRVVAWGWIEQPNVLQLQVDPECADLVDAVLDWFDDRATGTDRVVSVLDAETHLIEALRRRGYREPSDGPYFIHLRRGLDDLPEAVVPRGYRLRSVRDASDAGHRAAAHAATFSAPGRPSNVTADSYRQVMRHWPYEPGLDWIVADADDHAVAFCLVWMDDENAAAAMEPVGCHPEHRRLGLATAACLAALAAARERGAREAVVCARGDDAYPSARAVYRAMGFEPFARSRTFVGD